MTGIIGKKIGMTTVFDTKNNKQLPCTVISVEPNFITQIKTKEKDGYDAIQLGYGKKKNVSYPLQGHFKKANVEPCATITEFRGLMLSAPVLGKAVHCQEIFEEEEYIDVIGTSKGKGFQGVVKRHGFSGVGGQTHGQHNRERAPGSIGGCSYPARVFKNMRMAGQTGNKRVGVANLKILKMMPKENILLLQGSVPGARNSFIILKK